MSRNNTPLTDLAFIRERVRRGMAVGAGRVGPLLAERDALVVLYEDMQRWREGGGDVRDLAYVLDTLDVLAAMRPESEGSS